MTTKQTLGKRAQDNFRSNVGDMLGALYMRAIANVPFEMTDEMAFEAFVRGEDKPVVQRAGELYKHMRSRYYGTSLVVEHIPGSTYNLSLYFTGSLSWMPPSYLSGSIAAPNLPEQFVPTVMPFIEYATPITQMYYRTVKAYDNLRRLCENDLSRMRFLWPALDSIASMRDVNLGLLPKPKGVPAPSPELREDLNAATAFINMVLLMPEVPHRSRTINIDLTK